MNFRRTLVVVSLCTLVTSLSAAAWLTSPRFAALGTRAHDTRDAKSLHSAATDSAIARYARDCYKLDTALVSLANAAALHNQVASRMAFVRARLAYKRLEFLAEHYTPLTAAAVNGPAVDMPDDENPKVVIKPTGLQVIEDMLYGDNASVSRLDSVAIQARIARVNTQRLRDRATETRVIDAQLFEAARLQVARIVSLGLSDFDTPLSRRGLTESAESIRSLTAALSGFATGSPAQDSMQAIAARAIARLNKPNANAETFDYFDFIAQYANPLAIAISNVQQRVNIARLDNPRVLASSANTLFDSGAFRPDAFAGPGAHASSPQLIALGERLFHDTKLSGRGDRSCATCHNPARAFTDGRTVPLLLPVNGRSALSGAKISTRNTPSLYNAALQSSSFADSRVAFLEDQIKAVVNSPAEMGGDLQIAATTMFDDASYRDAFSHALGANMERATFDRDVRSALAAYIRSLVRLDSRFDLAMRGRPSTITSDERAGFNVFVGKGRCGSCHFVGLFNGTRPPAFEQSEAEVLGVPVGTRAGAALDTDRGVAGIDGATLHEHAFKTPTIRNAAVTAPYMHNGVFRTLSQVIEFYDAGGGTGRGLRVPNQTLSHDSLHLSAAEKRQLVSFIGALTDTSAALRSRH